MIKSYLVVKNGAKKESGEVYSMALRIGKNSQSSFEWLDDRDKFFTDDIRPVGTRIEVEQLEI